MNDSQPANPQPVNPQPVNPQPPTIFRQESLERLSSPEQLDHLMQVVNSRSWLSLSALASLLFLALIWSIFGRIPVTAMGQGILVHPSTTSNQLVGLTYFETDMGNRIQPGMSILIIPDTVRSERIGGILGRVKAISASPVTTLTAARQSLDATSLQQRTSQQQAIEVEVELEPDSSTLSGYRWSSANGRQLPLSPGMTTTARILLERKAPIVLAFPFLEGDR